MSHTLLGTLRKIILDLLSQGHPSLEQAARQLGVSSRTLQRKIAKENISYSQLVDEIRFAEACHLLNHSELTIRNIATQLGYADAGSFTRAFIRWYGNGPKRYRNSHKVQNRSNIKKTYLSLANSRSI